jgi:hypothetical protein
MPITSWILSGRLCASTESFQAASSTSSPALGNMIDNVDPWRVVRAIDMVTADGASALEAAMAV